MARSFTCRCGSQLSGSDDEELFRQMREHADQAHPEMQMTDDRIRQGIKMAAKDTA